MKTFIKKLALSALASILLSTAANAQAGEWTRCVAWNAGVQWNIVNGSTRDYCFQLARRCTNNPNVQVTFYTPPVIVNAPYTRCTLQ